MKNLKIIVAPDPRLKQKAKPIKEVTPEVKQLMNDMLELMYQSKGIGLAATQLGIMKRIIVLDIANPKEGEKPSPIMLANPKITKLSEEEVEVQEGCLSLPTFYEDVIRHETCTVTGLNENNQEVTIEADDWLAICLQHEIDHLDGIIFVDHISRIKRNMIIKKLEKAKKKGIFSDPKSSKNKSL